MSDTPTSSSDRPSIYHIRITGHLDDEWADWFGGASVEPEQDGNTLLICQVIDQSTLHGLLRRIRDLGMPLISINRVGPSVTTQLHFDECNLVHRQSSIGE